MLTRALTVYGWTLCSAVHVEASTVPFFAKCALKHEGAQASGVLKRLRASAACVCLPLSQGALLPSLNLLAGPWPTEARPEQV